MLTSDVLHLLEHRFEHYPERHPGLQWKTVHARIHTDESLLSKLIWMETTGGEPDVICRPDGSIVFCDCALESPAGRRSLCYDEAAWHSRKTAKPAGSALGTAAAHQLTILDESAYLQLQQRVRIDQKTSSWIHTPQEIRQLGGALFGDYRFGRVFIYHNGAESYYAARGFRCHLPIAL